MGGQCTVLRPRVLKREKLALMSNYPMVKNRDNNTLFWFILFFSVAGFLYRGVLIPLFYPPYPSNDFRGNFYPAVKAFLSGNKLYGDSLTYYYPPFSVFLIAPLTHLAMSLAEKVWFFVILLSLLVSFFLLVRSVPTRHSIFWALSLFVFSQFEPLYVDLSYYQMDLIILLILVTAYRLELRGLSFWTGVVLSLGSLIKITPIFFLFYFFVLKKWRSILGFLSGLVFFSVLTLPFFGVESWSDFFLLVIPRLLRESERNRLDQSFTNLLLDLRAGLGGKVLSKSDPWILAASATFALVILLSLWVALKRRKGDLLGLEYAATICAMLLSSSMMRETHLVLLLFPFWVMASFLFQSAKRDLRIVFLTAIAFTVVALRYAYTAPFLEKALGGFLLAKAKFFGTVLAYLCSLSLLVGDKSEAPLPKDPSTR